MLDKFTWMHSGQVGAPQMNGAAGSNGQMLQVLDACLIDGFNPQTVTIATKTATNVTLTFGVSHGYELGQLILVAGATDAALNGKHRVKTKTATTITIDAVGVAATTGAITTKAAPLGWQSIFGSADPLKRAYRSDSLESSKTVLYLDMTLPTGNGYNATDPAKRAMVSMCEDMTTLGVQINSYTDAENNYATNPNGRLLWYQARANSRAAAVNSDINRSWVIVGNDKVFYFFNAWTTQTAAVNQSRDFFAFGDFLGLDGKENKLNCGWLGAINTNDSSNVSSAFVGAGIGGESTVSADIKGYMIKSYNGTGSLKPLVMSSDGGITKYLSGYKSSIPDFPNPATQGLLGLPIYIMSDTGFRAIMPSILNIYQTLGSHTAWDKVVTDNILIVALYASASANSFFALDLLE